MLKIDSANKSFQLPYQLLSQTKNEELMLNAVARIEVGQQAREREKERGDRLFATEDLYTLSWDIWVDNSILTIVLSRLMR